MVPKIVVGVDISKLTLDIAVIVGNSPIKTVKIANSEEDIRKFLDLLKDEYRFKNREIIFCAEHMGLFASFLTKIVLKRKIPFYLESPLQIKRSLGIQRGKNDQLDAIRIAQYAKKNYQSMRLWQPPRLCLENLKTLLSIRKRLIKTKKILSTPLKDNLYFLGKYDRKYQEDLFLPSIGSILNDIKMVEKEMKRLINHDEKLCHLMSLVTSVPRIGNIVGIQMIVYTNEFLNIECPKKFASYCGVAPFEWKSGTSIKGRTKISHLANKDLKTNLHMAAIGFAALPKTNLGKYYLRKVDEGKNKQSVINAIRNKLIHRVFSCVKNQQPYKDL